MAVWTSWEDIISDPIESRYECKKSPQFAEYLRFLSLILAKHIFLIKIFAHLKKL